MLNTHTDKMLIWSLCLSSTRTSVYHSLLIFILKKTKLIPLEHANQIDSPRTCDQRIQYLPWILPNTVKQKQGMTGLAFKCLTTGIALQIGQRAVVGLEKSIKHDAMNALN